MQNVMGADVLEKMDKAETALTNAIASEEPISNRVVAQAQLAIIQGVRWNMARHDDCPALRTHETTMSRVIPMLIGLLIFGIAWAVYDGFVSGFRLP